MWTDFSVTLLMSINYFPHKLHIIVWVTLTVSNSGNCQLVEFIFWALEALNGSCPLNNGSTSFRFVPLYWTSCSGEQPWEILWLLHISHGEMQGWPACCRGRWMKWKPHFNLHLSSIFLIVFSVGLQWMPLVFCGVSVFMSACHGTIVFTLFFTTYIYMFLANVGKIHVWMIIFLYNIKLTSKSKSIQICRR